MRGEVTYLLLLLCSFSACWKNKQKTNKTTTKNKQTNKQKNNNKQTNNN